MQFFFEKRAKKNQSGSVCIVFFFPTHSSEFKYDKRGDATLISQKYNLRFKYLYTHTYSYTSVYLSRKNGNNCVGRVGEGGGEGSTRRRNEGVRQSLFLWSPLPISTYLSLSLLFSLESLYDIRVVQDRKKTGRISSTKEEAIKNDGEKK